MSIVHSKWTWMEGLILHKLHEENMKKKKEFLTKL